MEMLAAIDGSRFSAGVLDVATRMARLLPADIEAVTVHEEDSTEAAAAASRAGVPFRLLFGDPVTALLRALDDGEVTLAVLGAGTDSGRVTRAIVTRSPKGVIVVPRDLRWPAGEEIKVVVPLDGAEATTTALTRQLQPLVDHGAAVVGLHVFDAANAPHFWDSFGYDYLAWQRAFLRRSPVPGGHLQVAWGPVAAAAVDLAARERASLIAVAWSQDLSQGHAGIVTDLLRSSPVPLLLVPVATRARPAGVLVGSG